MQPFSKKANAAQAGQFLNVEFQPNTVVGGFGHVKVDVAKKPELAEFLYRIGNLLAGNGDALPLFEACKGYYGLFVEADFAGHFDVG